MYCHKLSLDIKLSVNFDHGKGVNWMMANFRIIHLLENKVPIITHFCTQSNGEMRVGRRCLWVLASVPGLPSMRAQIFKNALTELFKLRIICARTCGGGLEPSL